jgi:hypothetical protein
MTVKVIPWGVTNNIIVVTPGIVFGDDPGIYITVLLLTGP